MTSVSARVVAGAVFLSVTRGDPWWYEVDLIQLDMASPGNCVLGQLYGNYYDATEELGLTTYKAHELGFYVQLGDGHGNYLSSAELRNEYVALNLEWRDFITELRKYSAEIEALSA